MFTVLGKTAGVRVYNSKTVTVKSTTTDSLKGFFSECALIGLLGGDGPDSHNPFIADGNWIVFGFGRPENKIDLGCGNAIICRGSTLHVSTPPQTPYTTMIFLLASVVLITQSYKFCTLCKVKYYNNSSTLITKFGNQNLKD